MSTATNAAAKPTSIEFWAPAMTRESMSMPASSVPIQWAAEGASKGSPLGASIEYGSSTGARSATTAKSATMTIPATIVGRRSRGRASLIPTTRGSSTECSTSPRKLKPTTESVTNRKMPCSSG